MIITFEPPQLLKGGVQIGHLREDGVVLIVNAKMSGLVKGHMRKALEAPKARFEVVKHFPPHGGPGEPVQGMTPPDNARSEPQVGEVSGPFTPPPAIAPASDDGRWVEGGITYVPTDDPKRVGWVGQRVMRVFGKGSI